MKKLNVEGDLLRPAVEWAARSIHRVPTLPTLSGLRLTASGDGTLTVVGTDLTTVAENTVDVAGDAQVDLVVPAGPLGRFLKAAGGSLLKLDVADDRLTVKASAGRITLHTLPLEDWPASLPDADGPVEMKGLADALAACATCAGTDQARPVLMAVAVAPDGDGRVRLSASDSYKAHVRWLDGHLADEVLIPVEAATRAARAGASTLAAAGGFAALGCDGSKRLCCSGVVGQFHDLTGFIDPDAAATVEVDVGELEAAVALASPTARETSSGAQLRLATDGDSLLVATAESEQGDGDAQCPCHHDGDPVDLVVAHKHLLASARAAADDHGRVRIGVREADKPLVMRPGDDPGDGRVSICMPIRV